MGQVDEALAIMQTEQFENWEGREISGPLYRKVIIHKALKETENGDLQKAVELISGVHDYPENITMGNQYEQHLQKPITIKVSYTL